jgi:large subunit ribosomal protein L6
VVGGIMARGGNKPIEIPEKVKVVVNGSSVSVEGPNGKLNRVLHGSILAEIKDKQVLFKRSGNEKLDKALHGTSRALVNNMIMGVLEPFVKTLQVEGVGYKIAVQGNKLTVNVGFTHPVEMTIPAGISAVVEKQTIIILKSADKELLGGFASKIRDIKDPDPYKAKGVKYLDEHIRKKAGKTAAGAGGTGGK